MIRALAVGELRPRDWWRVLYREAGMGLTLGLALGGMLPRATAWCTTR